MSVTPRPYEIRQRTLLFARDVLQAYPKDARRHAPTAEVWRQLIRSAVSVGANLEEANAASGKLDFAYRIKVALREARESQYWLRLVEAAQLLGGAVARPLTLEATELVAILTTLAKKAAANAKK